MEQAYGQGGHGMAAILGRGSSACAPNRWSRPMVRAGMAWPRSWVLGRQPFKH
jgi:hypothetical protein